MKNGFTLVSTDCFKSTACPECVGTWCQVSQKMVYFYVAVGDEFAGEGHERQFCQTCGGVWWVTKQKENNVLTTTHEAATGEKRGRGLGKKLDFCG